MPKRITTTDEQQHTHIARELNHPPHHRFQPGIKGVENQSHALFFDYSWTQLMDRWQTNRFMIDAG